jgi:hypothetical protein
MDLDDKNKITEYLPVIIRYILSARNVSVAALKEAVKHLPKGEETMETTAEQLRQEGHDLGFRLGEQKGELNGIQIGEQLAIQELLIETVQERFGPIHPTLVGKIKRIESSETLKGLFLRDIVS